MSKELYDDRYFLAFPEPAIEVMGKFVTEIVVDLGDNIILGEN